MACLLGVYACSGSFPSCHEENDPDPKSGWDVDPDPRVVESVTGWVPVKHPITQKQNINISMVIKKYCYRYSL